MAQAGTTGGLGPNRLERLIDEYLAACRAPGLAIRTVREAYRYPLYEVFLPFCADEGIEEPGQVTSRVLDRLTTRLLDVGGRKGPAVQVHCRQLRPIDQRLPWLGAA